MPGADYTLRCPNCTRLHELRVGFSLSYAYEQFVCHRCETLRSEPVEEEIVPGPCPACGLQLERWRGRVWFEHGEARLDGPCPGCFATITEADALEREPWT
jgi:hypothetical protein